MQSDGIEIPTEVAEYLAYSVDTNLRDMEGVLNSMIFHATLLKKEIDLDLAKEVMKNIVKEIQSDVSVTLSKKTVGDYFRVELDAMKGKVKKREIVFHARVAMYFCKRLYPAYTGPLSVKTSAAGITARYSRARIRGRHDEG